MKWKVGMTNGALYLTIKYNKLQSEVTESLCFA